MNTGRHRHDAIAAPAADGADPQLVLVRRSGRPALRFFGTLSLDVDRGCTGDGALACRIWTVKSGRYVRARGTWGGLAQGQAAARVAPGPALMAAP